jgi:2-keto-3-deoxy-L-rhamnonate aldolase RhmA
LDIGTFAATYASAKRMTDMGFTFLLAGMDISFLAAGANDIWQQCVNGIKSSEVGKVDHSRL